MKRTYTNAFWSFEQIPEPNLIPVGDVASWCDKVEEEDKDFVKNVITLGFYGVKNGPSSGNNEDLKAATVYVAARPDSNEKKPTSYLIQFEFPTKVEIPEKCMNDIRKLWPTRMIDMSVGVRSFVMTVEEEEGKTTEVPESRVFLKVEVGSVHAPLKIQRTDILVVEHAHYYTPPEPDESESVRRSKKPTTTATSTSKKPANGWLS